MTKLDRDGAWIELTWDKPVQVGQIQITHDTGLHRDLTMTSLYWLQGEMLSGPQPETSRNYEVVGVLPNGSERQLAKVENNYQRLRRHHFDPLKLRSIRITVERGTGPEVGIYEVRAYEA